MPPLPPKSTPILTIQTSRVPHKENESPYKTPKNLTPETKAQKKDKKKLLKKWLLSINSLIT